MQQELSRCRGRLALDARPTPGQPVPTTLCVLARQNLSPALIPLTPAPALPFIPTRIFTSDL
jgi:hypothetical protein